ncbi:uncharacterized protein Dmul_04900 [Desulfococcus multivorans]|nr:uncharacterized protein Dmul_04900 [Desulfococcus multivorans]
MTTNLQNDVFIKHYKMVGEREAGLKFYPRNTPLSLTSPNDVTVTILSLIQLMQTSRFAVFT